MTRSVRDRILKDANGDISDHLRNHIHLTNCIHLKNHMHKHSPILADRTLMRELVVLQRSRSLRDPSTSPPSWNSPSVVELLSRRGDKDVIVGNGRRSVDADHQMDYRRFSGASPPLSNVPRAKVVPGDASKYNDDRSSKSGLREHRRVRREELGGRNSATDHMHGHDEPRQDVSGNSDPKDKKSKQKGTHKEDINLKTLLNEQLKGMRKDDINLKTLSEQLNEVRMDSDDRASSHIHVHAKPTQNELAGDEAEANIRGYDTGLKRVKRRKFRSNRRTRAVIGSRDTAAQNEMSVASNTLAQVSAGPTYRLEEREEAYAEQNAMGAPGNGCGIPWNWSRIHHRGKTFLDMAGRSLSCGLSDSRLKRDISDIPVMSEHSSSSLKSDAEALPLLMEASGSQGSTDRAAWVHDYSGELGIFADSLLRHEIDSDLASEARSGNQNKLRGTRNGRHQNLTQKYMPRTFRDLVGQNLVAQALSNAVVKRKVGLLYVFYGPHGTGKTSCARIFARALNCQSQEHPKPCGFCNSCVAYETGKSRNIKEVGPVSNFDFKSIMDLLDSMNLSQLPSQYKVFVFDDCDTLSHDSWSTISKVIDRAPRRVVFILVSSSLDVLPHIIISRCQKFFFPKMKDADIIYTLQWIATKEDLEIDRDALKLIASRSDGSLRDAEMTLEQLSLLGQRISVPLVQELVGLISDEKLVDLLDLALSADTVNTVKNLREIMESGVEPLALMSQLATVITDILAGSYDLTKGRPRRKFFRRQALSKEDMEKLRQALKTLSEAEKQLRMSNDRLTWLTAALLQLAPDQQYILPTSSADTSFNHSPLVVNNDGGRDRPRKTNVERTELPSTGRGMSKDVRIGNFQVGSSSDIHYDANMKRSCTDSKGLIVSADLNRVSGADMNRSSDGPSSGKVYKDIEAIWLEVLKKIRNSSIKEFMYQEGKLISVTFGAAPTVQLTFSSPLTKSTAEKHRTHILQAFESVLGSSVTIEIRCESKRDSRAGVNAPLIQPASRDRSSQMVHNRSLTTGSNELRDRIVKDRDRMGNSEIVEIVASPKEAKGNGRSANNLESDRGVSERRNLGEQSQSRSLVRGKVSLAHVIQQAEGCTQRNGWSNRKAVSIAEKLEQENLRLEPKYRSLFCWKASRATRRKLSRLKIRTRKPQSLLKIVSCGKCLSARSPK